MIKIARFDENFNDIYNKEPRKVIAYGAGGSLVNNFDKIPYIDIICDADSENIKEVKGIEVYDPEILKTIKEPIYVIICIKNEDSYDEVLEMIREYCDTDVIVFHLFNNIAFGYNVWGTAKSFKKIDSPSKLNINIVCTDSSWIFKKFADRMCECLSKQKVDVTISPYARGDVDVNHHIPYDAFEPFPNDTLMITHVDNMKKIEILKKQLKIAQMGICMSKDTMEKLTSYGVPRNKLCYINPAHDGVIKPHKYIIGITHKCHDSEDVRKRATAILDIVDVVNPDYFKFVIMGAGWDNIVDIMRNKGFEVDYYPEFIYDIYNALMQKIDYFLYTGFDEGTMGYLDALAAGAGTIVTPQGYHLDADCSIDYPCSSVKEFREAFMDLQRKREERINAVSEWTWGNYTLKHLEIWNYILRRKSLVELYQNQLIYSDGIFSAMIEDNRV
jgi:hypothetical protein